ncbi:hypothetical protein PG989_010330 [Apiospora arundinis]
MAFSKSRKIDALPEVEHKREMKVLVLGMPRTGSISIRHGLRKLGFECFHGAILEVSPWKFQYWDEAIRAKYYGEGKPYGRREFDKLLGEFEVSINFPGTLFAEELIEAYPEAKVILTVRDVDKWKQSLTQSVDSTRDWKSFDCLAPFDPIWGPWWRFHKLEHAIRPLLAPKGEKRGFLDHYERIREIVPKERLLEYRVGEGWERLCDFLDVPVPKEPFPHVNSTEQFIVGRQARWNHAFQCMLVRMVPLSILVAVGACAAWWYGSADMLILS